MPSGPADPLALALERHFGWSEFRPGQRPVVEALLAAPALHGVERVYLMTTNSSGFYEQLGFGDAAPQALLVKQGVSGGSGISTG